jgi:hypothetical protein
VLTASLLMALLLVTLDKPELALLEPSITHSPSALLMELLL